MKKDNVVKYVRYFFAVFYLFMVPHTASDIMSGRNSSREYPIKLLSEPMLYMGTIFLVIIFILLNMYIWERVSKERKEKELQSIKPFVKDFFIFFQAVIVYVFHQVAKFYRPSKLGETTNEYILFVLLFWAAMLWFVIYIIVVELISEIKKQNRKKNE